MSNCPPPSPAGPPAARRRLVRIDLAPMRSREFRLLFVGEGVSFAGSMLTYVVVPYQAYRLTGSSLVVGLLGLAELGPLLVTAFVGGALADAIDRRRMVRLTEAATAALSGILVVNAARPHPALWVLFVVTAAMATLNGLQRPSLEALVPRVVAHEHLAAAGALRSLVMNVGQVAGPPAAGVLIAVWGVPVAYGADVASFSVSLLALSMMHAVPPPPSAERPSLSSIRAGLRYARSRRELLGTYFVDMNAMFFGMPMALFPQIASRLGGAAALGLLYAAPAAGSLVVSLASGWVGRVRRQGRAIVVAAGVWGVAIVGLGLASTLWLSLLALVGAGAADMVSGLFRTTMWNQTIPDAFRGRLAGIEMISYSSGPSLGNVEAGLVEALAGLRASILSGGLLCVAGTVVIAVALPQLWRFDADPGATAAPDGLG